MPNHTTAPTSKRRAIESQFSFTNDFLDHLLGISGIDLSRKHLFDNVDVITGVTGQLGSRVAANMLSEVPGTSLVFTAPNPEKLDPKTVEEWKSKGVTIVKLDYADKDAITKVFVDNKVDRVWMVSGVFIGLPRQLQHRNVIDAAVAAKVKHLTYCSFFGANRQGYYQYVLPDHTFSEAYLSFSGLEYNIMRNNLYLENFFINSVLLAVNTNNRWITRIREGSANFVAKEDSARVAAALLLGKGEKNKAYDVCGKLISERKICEMISEYSKIPFSFEHTDDEGYYDYLETQGIHRTSEERTDSAPLLWCSDDMVTNSAAVEDGLMTLETTTIKALTGRDPLDPTELLEPCAFAWKKAAN